MTRKISLAYLTVPGMDPLAQVKMASWDPVWPSLHGPRLCLNCRQVPVRFFIRSKPFFLLFWVPICSESPLPSISIWD